jgi:ABC-type Fe3+-siderophore transport system permease subunit
MPTLAQLFACASGLAWLVVIVAAVNVHLAARATAEEAPPPANSDWYLIMQGALCLAFLFMLALSFFAWLGHGLTTVEAIATACFALGFAVTAAGLAITVVRWMRAKRAMQIPFL